MTFSVNLLSKHRTQLMGVGILLVVLFHSGYTSPNFELINWIRRIGYIGVEFFLFVSGIGMFYSLKGDDNILLFYKKRLLRIMPLYIPIILVFGWRYDLSWGDILLNASTLSFWLHTKLFNWYVPSLVVLYLLTPFYMKVFNKKPLLVTLLAIAASFGLMLLLPRYLSIFTCRIPIFLIGIYAGKMCFENAKLGIKSLLILFIAFLAGFALFKTKVMNFDLEFTLIAPFFMIVLVCLFSLAKNYKFPVLTFLGDYSLSIFLIYDLIADAIRRDQMLGDLSLIVPQWCVELFILSLVCITAYVFQRLMYGAFAKINR